MSWPDNPEERSPVVSELRLEPAGPLRGNIRPPGDKSISHRALLLGALAEGTSVVRGLADGDDVRHSALAVRALGAGIEGVPPELRISGGPARLHEPDTVIDVGNSGTTIRLLAGLVAPHPWFVVLDGDRSVARRPMDRVVEPLRRMGAVIDGRAQGTRAPLAIRGGTLTGIEFHLPIASAQVKSAVLLAGLGAAGTTTVVEPAPTRAHTEEMLGQAGADIAVSADGRRVTVGPSILRPLVLDVPADPSQAAFWVVAACLVPGSEVTVSDTYVGRGRAAFLDVLVRMGADISLEPRSPARADIRVRASRLHGTEVAGQEIPSLIDEIPALAVAAAVADGASSFRDASELAAKETNRLHTIAAGLRELGADVSERPDGFDITGVARLHGGVVDSQGDHRIAMAMAVAGLVAQGTTTVQGWDAVATSYPGFSADLASLLP